MENYPHNLHVEKTIGRKFALIIACFSVISGLLVVSFLTYMNSREYEQELKRNITEMHLSSSETLKKALWLTNEEVVQTVLWGFSNVPSVEKIVLTKDDGKIITIGDIKSKRTLIHEHNLYYDYRGDSVWVGHLSIVVGFGDRNERVINETISLAVVVGLLALTGGGLAIFLFNYSVGRHLKSIAGYCESISWKKLDKELLLERKNNETSDELDLIVNSINSTCSTLSKSLIEVQENENLLKKIAENYPNSYVMIVEKDLSISFTSGQEFKNKELHSQPNEDTFIDDFFKQHTTSYLPHYNKTFRGEEQAFHYDSDTEHYVCKTVPLYAEDGSIPRILVVTENITERYNLEYRLQQSQKMEAIGTLAGGIAHDFNNILSVIMGYTEIVKEDVAADSEVAENLQNVMDASLRAKKLVQQILIFSRQDQTERVMMDPTTVVEETLNMLRSSLPATIEIHTEIENDIGLIFADSTQLSQILMNLATNAYHSMEQTGGILKISLKRKMVTKGTIANEPGVEPGLFVQFSVSDSGSGIDPAVMEKIFNPFYTTKEVGKGTGMGLSILHGIVKTYGGFIEVNSEYGQGATFNVYLPVGEGKSEEVSSPTPLSPKGRERVLLIDDEEMLVQVSKDILEGLGYQVTVKTDATEALELFRNSPADFDIVITDQTMPNMTGTEIALEMLQIRHDIPIVLTTGYTATITEQEVKRSGIKELACKPLTKSDLAILTRRVLDMNMA